MPAVRAKFKVEAKDVAPDGTTNQIRMSAVFDGSPENKEFFKYTPTGTLNLGVVNEVAAAAFEVGKEYYLDFTPAA